MRLSSILTRPNLASMQSVSMRAAFKINGLILYPSYHQNWRVTEYAKTVENLPYHSMEKAENPAL